MLPHKYHKRDEFFPSTISQLAPLVWLRREGWRSGNS